jgi:hypothetical protein
VALSRTWRLSIIVALGLGVLLLFWWDAYWITQIVWEGRKLLAEFVTLVAIGSLPVIGAALDKRRRTHHWYGVMWLATFPALIGGIVLLLWTGYAGHRSYARQAEIVTTPVPDLSLRAPYLVGTAQAGPSLGEIVGEAVDTTYLPDQDRFTTLLKRRAFLGGYEAGFSQEVPLTGRGRDAERCTFDTDRADARIDGKFSHSLGRKLARLDRWTTFDDEDVYVVCDDGVPKVVIPLKRQVGLWVVSERPAGVAVYNGRTGELTLSDGSDVAGPTYPISLAARQRKALTATDGFGAWLARRSGWKVSDDGANEGNDAEFTLKRADGSGIVYATLLTPRGTTSSVTAVAVVPARYEDQNLAPLTVHRLDPNWVSPQVIVARIKSEYRDVCCYQLDRVFEVMPTGGQGWAATLGSEQNITYRVVGNGPLEGEEATCLLDAAGNRLRCGTTVASKPPPPTAGDKPLTELTDDELADLQRKVTDEILRRLRDG